MASQDQPLRSIHEAYRRQCAQRPSAEALVCGDTSLSYGELDRQSNQFARFLQQEGVAEGRMVATVLDRSTTAITALLGILKTGAAYVALDPQWPAERLDQVTRDSGASLVLTDRRAPGGDRGCMDGPPVVLLDDAAQAAARHAATPPGVAGGPDRLAYVMYTSGSTGQPKGVMIPHRAVINLVIDNPYARFGPGETFLSLAPLAFDASTFEIWGALLNGGRLAVMPDRTPSLAGIGCAIRRHGVSTLWLTAGLFHLMVDQQLEALRPLRQLLAGGDALSRPHVERALRELPGRLINGYGPTENTTFSCCCTLDTACLGDGGVPIGTPVAHTEARILDDAMREVPDGTAGMLYVGGPGLAIGYLNRPEETARSFVHHPFDPQPGARLYRTGDLVLRRPDGLLEFVGRADRQVKVNGQRVELEAVELAIRAAGALDAAVVARTDPAAGARIDAFVVLQDGDAGVAALQARLRAALPAAMRPASVTALDALPLTANGKVDRAALSVAQSPPAPAPPRGVSETEQALAEIWSACLGRPVTDLHANFFDLGGTSLELLRAQAEISRRFGAEVTTLDLFEFATLSALAHRLGALAASGGPAAPPPSARAPNAPLSSAPLPSVSPNASRALATRQRLRDARQQPRP